MRSMTMTVTMGCKYRRAVASIEVFLNVLCSDLGQNADGKLISLMFLESSLVAEEKLSKADNVQY